MDEPLADTLATVAGDAPPWSRGCAPSPPASRRSRSRAPPRCSCSSSRPCQRSRGGSADARWHPAGPALGAATPGALLEPSRATRPAFAVVVLADYLAALPVEDHHRRGAASAPPA